MSLSEPTVVDTASSRPTHHQSFLVVGGFLYLKYAALASALAILIYVVWAPLGTRYGGSWVGYIFGTIGALLIFWLTWFGYRKRTYAEGHALTAARLSQHVYFGLALFVIATLHTGFHFDWNIHTLAYGLMCVVIASGLFGIYFYSRYPRLMTENRGTVTMQSRGGGPMPNRGSVTMQEMLSSIVTLNDQLRGAAQPFDSATAMLIQRSIEASPVAGGVWRQLSGRYPHCATAAAIATMDVREPTVPDELQPPWREMRLLLERKGKLLQQIRRDIRYKAYMDVWLYLHVPITFALLAALIAHIVLIIFFLPVLPRV